jgi:hypothetical protein
MSEWIDEAAGIFDIGLIRFSPISKKNSSHCLYLFVSRDMFRLFIELYFFVDHRTLFLR